MILPMNIKCLPGFLFCFTFAIPAFYLGQRFPLVGGPVFGILFGIAAAGFKRPPALAEGISFTGQKVLQYSIILLGFEMNLFYVLEVGAKSFSVMVFTLLAAFVVAYYAGALLKLDRKTASLIGAGTAICGGSAIAAVAPIIDAQDKDIVFSVSTIFLFNVIAVFLFPFLGHFWGLSDPGFGMWAGTAINDTSSVVAAGYSYSEAAGGYATIVKLTRALMIVPVCLGFAFFAAWRQDKKSPLKMRRIIPWFIVWFAAASVINTAGVLPAAVTQFFGGAGKFAIILAMSAIGLNTNIRSLVKNGLRPIILGLACWFAVASVSLLIQHLTGFI